MNAFVKASTALGLLLAMSTFILPALGAHQVRPPERHRVADFAKARALASPPINLLPTTSHAPETDGLSRNDEDCNMGCIDH